jgi:hypothetical protein
MIIAGAADGSVGLRDHMANSFFDFSADETAERFVTSGEVITGETCSNDGVEGTSEDWGTGSGTDINSDIGSDIGSDTRSETGSAAGFSVGSGTCSEAS